MLKAAPGALMLLFAVLPAAAQEPPPPRYLVICLDGVGYDLVEEMHRRGELANFAPPRPLINAFPSLTNLGLVEILQPVGAPPARGYEDFYFDPARNRLRGGIFHRMSRQHFIAGTYRDLFDSHPHQLSMTFEYALPVVGPWLNGVVNTARIRDGFKKSVERVYLAYYDASDTAMHLNGRWLVREQLRVLNRLAGELRRDSSQPVEVILFSDHGNELRRLRRAGLETALRRAGFRLDSRLKDERSVVLPRFGLVAAAALYTQPGREAVAAHALRSARGVDLVVYRDGDGLFVLGRDAEARVERRLKDARSWFRYRAAAGDPLDLAPIIVSLAGRADADGFIAEDDWLSATAEHDYPDPLRRLWAGFDGLVEQPASVLVSLDDGFYTGSQLLDVFAWMQATHGNLRRAQSCGMILATDAALMPDGAPLTGENFWSRIPAMHEIMTGETSTVANAGPGEEPKRLAEADTEPPARRGSLATWECSHTPTLGRADHFFPD